MKTKFLTLTVLTLLFIVACESDDSEQFDSMNQNDHSNEYKKVNKGKKDNGQFFDSQYLDKLNDGLAIKGVNYRIAMAEYITEGGGDEAGLTVYSKVVGNKQLVSDFVPFDPRREPWSGPIDGPNDNITYVIDQTSDAIPAFGGLTAAQTDAAITRSIDTWQEANCSDLDLSRNPDFGLDIGGTFNGDPNAYADIHQCGFNINFAGNILGVTITYIFGEFVNGEFFPSDIDNNKKNDVAVREIYYDSSYPWGNDGSGNNVDVETVAAHEFGHGLSQGHFGTVGEVQGNLRATPRAVMNALYTGPYRDLAGTDNGGHCSNWGQWPNN